MLQFELLDPRIPQYMKYTDYPDRIRASITTWLPTYYNYSIDNHLPDRDVVERFKLAVTRLTANGESAMCILKALYDGVEAIEHSVPGAASDNFAQCFVTALLETLDKYLSSGSRKASYEEEVKAEYNTLIQRLERAKPQKKVESPEEVAKRRRERIWANKVAFDAEARRSKEEKLVKSASQAYLAERKEQERKASIQKIAKRIRLQSLSTTVWRKKSCPRCHGDLYLSSDMSTVGERVNSGDEWTCISCGYIEMLVDVKLVWRMSTASH